MNSLDWKLESARKKDADKKAGAISRKNTKRGGCIVALN